MSVKKITKSNFQAEVMENSKPVLVDFWATWCGPCQMMSPVVDEIAGERSDIAVGKVNVDEEPELANLFQISNIPTLVLMEQGAPKAQSVGFLGKEAVLNLLK